MATKIVKNFNFPNSTDTYQVNAERLNGKTADEIITPIEERVQTVYDKIVSRGEQLIVNGSGLMGNDTNFSKWTFDGAVTNNSAGSFTYPLGSKATLFTDDFFPVDPALNYQLKLDFKSKNGLGTMYSYLAFYDVDKNEINVKTHVHNSASNTTLAKDLKAGDTVVYLTDVSGWSTTYNYGFYLRIWNYTNSYGYTYPVGTYTRNSLTLTSSSNKLTNLDTTNKTVTLKSAYSGATIPAGTPVSQGGDAATYKYIAAVNAKIPTSWTTYTGNVGGVDLSGGNAAGMFPPATAYAKVGFLWNNNTASDQIWMTNVSVTDVSLSNNALADAKTYTDTEVAKKAPTSHASTATTYGIGTGNNYGHVKLSDSTSTTSGASAGIAATPTAVKAAYDLAKSKASKSDVAKTFYVHITPDGNGGGTVDVTPEQFLSAYQRGDTIIGVMSSDLSYTGIDDVFLDTRFVYAATPPGGVFAEAVFSITEFNFYTDEVLSNRTTNIWIYNNFLDSFGVEFSQYYTGTASSTYVQHLSSTLSTGLEGKQDLITSSNKLSASNVSGLATVATSGSYNDLSNKPSIPTVNNATLTIQKNGTNVATFTANSSTNATANITVPTGAAADKGVDTSIAAASTSTNLPTSKAVAAFVEGKGYKTTDNDTGATSVEVTGTGNAVTAASYDATTRKLTLTKGATYSNNSGDITGVTAGNGLTGGGSSGSVTLAVGAGDGISVAADAISVSYGTSAAALGTSSAGSAKTVSRSDHVHALPALTSCTGTLTVAKGGTGYTSIVDTTYTTARYRASSLHSSATTPSSNGVICWQYE